MNSATGLVDVRDVTETHKAPRYPIAAQDDAEFISRRERRQNIAIGFVSCHVRSPRTECLPDTLLGQDLKPVDVVVQNSFSRNG